MYNMGGVEQPSVTDQYSSLRISVQTSLIDNCPYRHQPRREGRTYPTARHPEPREPEVGRSAPAPSRACAPPPDTGPGTSRSGGTNPDPARTSSARRSAPSRSDAEAEDVPARGGASITATTQSSQDDPRTAHRSQSISISIPSFPGRLPRDPLASGRIGTFSGPLLSRTLLSQTLLSRTFAFTDLALTDLDAVEGSRPRSSPTPPTLDPGTDIERESRTAAAPMPSLSVPGHTVGE
jgi:hypothetical protein